MHKTLLHVDFLAGRDDGHQGFARLEVELPFCSSTAVELEHPVWKEARSPIRVSYNLEEEQTFYVCLEAEELGTTDAVAQQKEIYQNYSWTVS